ncbi:MAG: DUF2061 domain-containing protein [Gammaproteobacteria bacterium]|nr:DUF2061 domain-containing protein [Gammaproteobacteria bacterium]
MSKTISFAAVHFTVAFSVGYFMTGSVLVGSAIALVEPAINTVAYYFHEQIWNHRQKTADQTGYEFVQAC